VKGFMVVASRLIYNDWKLCRRWKEVDVLECMESASLPLVLTQAEVRCVHNDTDSGG